MATLFISHRKADVLIAERLAQELQQAGHDVWFDDWKIDIGDSIVGRINEGLTQSDYLVLCYSASGTSDWVDREWQSVLMRQLSDHSIKVLPVLLSGGHPPSILKDIAFFDLLNDWDKGVQALLKAIQ